MKKDVFLPANILIPEGISLEKWSVIACDQFSSEEEYWEQASAIIGDEPSTLKMIIPEAYLCDFDENETLKRLCAVMNDYLEQKIFREYKDAFVYVERTLPDGTVRPGLVGAVDLDQYDFSAGVAATANVPKKTSAETAAILASEGTILDRLPVRVKARRAAALELPHIMAFINDSDKTIIEPLAEVTETLPLLYDFELIQGGGHIRGKLLQGKHAEQIQTAFRLLHEKTTPLMVMGDGNHSLAAAKTYWDELKQNLTVNERKAHPSRIALLEVNNVYDPSISFEAIHRCLFGVEPSDFVSAFEKAMSEASKHGNYERYEFKWIIGGKNGIVTVAADSIGEALSMMQRFLDDYARKTGCCVDYIHGEDTTKRLATEEDDRAGLILPALTKEDLFKTVSAGGVFPKKAFSVGSAREKRYYLECREIKG